MQSATVINWVPGWQFSTSKIVVASAILIIMFKGAPKIIDTISSRAVRVASSVVLAFTLVTVLDHNPWIVTAPMTLVANRKAEQLNKDLKPILNQAKNTTSKVVK